MTWLFRFFLALSLGVAPAAAAEAPKLAATVEFYVHQEPSPGCGVALAHSRPPLFIICGQERRDLQPPGL